MEMIVAYLVGVVVFGAAFAIRAPHQELRTVFVLCLFWPVSIVLMFLLTALSLSGWELEVADNAKMFGFRKPTNPAVRGFAVTVFGLEIQFYSFYKKA